MHKIFRNTRLKEIFEEDFFNTHRDDDIDQFVNILIDTFSLINMKSIYSSRPSLKSIQNNSNLMVVISRKAEDIKDSISDTIHDHGKGILAGAGAIGAGMATYKYLKNKKLKSK